MNERELDQVLRAIHVERMTYQDTDAVVRHALSAPIEQTPQRRFVLPRFPTWRFGSMFNATKSLVAGAIVALFGGLLLTGVTQQPTDEPLPAAASASSSPEASAPVQTVRSDLLPGVDLVTEEVELGVVRVLSDGVGHDLVAEPPEALVFGPDGNLILFTPSGQEGYSGGYLDRFYTMGEQGERSIDNGFGGDPAWFDAAIDRGGNLFVRLAGPDPLGISRLDGDTWTESIWPDGTVMLAVELGPDGTVWVTGGSTGPWPRVARIENGVPSDLPMADDGSRGEYVGGPGNFVVASDGTVWVASLNGRGGPVPEGTKGLVSFDGEAWREPEVPIDADGKHLGPLAVGSDGTLWVYAVGPNSEGSPSLLRMRDGDWSVFTESDGVPRLTRAQCCSARLAVDGEGTLWIANAGAPSGDPELGLLSFDGSTWRQYLKGQDVNRVELASDGSVWATSSRDCTDVPKKKCRDAGGGGLYVIAPGAVTATE